MKTNTSQKQTSTNQKIVNLGMMTEMRSQGKNTCQSMHLRKLNTGLRKVVETTEKMLGSSMSSSSSIQEVTTTINAHTTMKTTTKVDIIIIQNKTHRAMLISSMKRGSMIETLIDHMDQATTVQPIIEATISEVEEEAITTTREVAGITMKKGTIILTITKIVEARWKPIIVAITIKMKINSSNIAEAEDVVTMFQEEEVATTTTVVAEEAMITNVEDIKIATKMVDISNIKAIMTKSIDLIMKFNRSKEMIIIKMSFQ